MRVAGSRPQRPVGQGAWGPGPQGLGPGSPGAWGLFPTKFANLLEGNEAGIPPLPPPQPRPRFGLREKGRGFSPSPPSATIQHAPQGRRIRTPKTVPQILGKPPYDEEVDEGNEVPDKTGVPGLSAEFLLGRSGGLSRSVHSGDNWGCYMGT